MKHSSLFMFFLGLTFVCLSLNLKNYKKYLLSFFLHLNSLKLFPSSHPPNRPVSTDLLWELLGHFVKSRFLKVVFSQACSCKFTELGIRSFQKNVPIFVFFSVLYKRMFRSLCSFPFFSKECSVLCFLFCSL